MNTRLDLTGASVLPFQFPSLKEEEAPPPIDSAFPSLTAAADASPSSQANGFDHPDMELERAAAIAEGRAAGHAEGLALGLEEGRELGYAAAFAEGAKAGEASLAAPAQQLAAIVARLGAPIAVLDQPVEEAIAALALEVARCVIGAEVRHSREFLVRLVREAIAKVPLEMGAPRVLLNPADLELIRRLVPEIEAGNATLVEDESIEAGGCLVVADGDEPQLKDRRWNPRATDGVSQVNLTLSARWRAVMLTLFEGEDE
jgi:flagellar assembly protein FliH